MEIVRILCPACQNVIEVPKIYRGKEMKCVICQEPISVPLNLPTEKSSTEPPSTLSLLQIGVVSLLFLAGLVYCETREPSRSTSAEETSAEQSARDLRVAARVWLTQNLADPDYEIIEMTSNNETGADTILVDVTVRGKNALGGYRIQTFRLTMNPAGDRALFGELLR
jgi:hypothetical protein